MALINYQDFLDFPALAAAIKDLENTNKQFGAITQDVFKGIKTNVDATTKSLRDNLSTIQNYNVNQKNAAQGIADISKSTDTLIQKQEQYQQVTKGLNTLAEQLSKNNIILNGTVEKIQKEFSQLSDTEEKDIQRKKELITISNVLAGAITKYNTTISGTISSYDSLQKTYKDAIANAKNLAAEYGIDSKEAIAAADAAKVYADQLANINNLVKQRPKQVITEVVPTAVATDNSAYATGIAVSEAEIAATQEQLAATRELNIEKQKSITITEGEAAASAEDAATAKLLADAKDKLAFALSEVNVQLKGYALQTEQANLAAKAEAAQALGLAGAYERLVADTAAAKKEALQIGAQYGSTSIEFKQAAASAALLDKELKLIDAGVGNSQRNVGNYAGGITKGFKDIFGSVRQLANILPGIGQQGLYLLAFEGVSKLVDAFTNAAESAEKFKKSEDVLQDSLADANGEYAKAVSNVNELKINIDLAKQGFLNKSEVLKEYNSTIGKTTGEVKDLDEAEQALIKNGDAYIKLTLLKAAANLALNNAAQSLLKAEQERQKADKEFANALADGRVSAGGAGGLGTGAFNEKDFDAETKRIQQAQQTRKARAIKSEQDAANKELDIAKKFQSDAAKIAADNNFDFFGSMFDDKKAKRSVDAAFEIIKDALTHQIADLQDFVNNGSILFNERYAAAKEEADLEKKLSDVVLNEDIKNGKNRVLAEQQNAERIADINKQLAANLQKINQDRNKNPFPDQPITAPVDNSAAELAAHQQFINKLVKQVEDGGKAIQTTNKLNEQYELQANEDLYDLGLIKREAYEKAKTDIARKYQLIDLQIQLATEKSLLSLKDKNSNAAEEIRLKIAQLEAQIKNLGNTAEDTGENLAKIFGDLYKNIEAISNIAGNNVAEFFGSLTHVLEDIAKNGKASLEDYANAAISLGYGIVDELNAADENRIANLEKNKDRELSLTQNNAAAQAAINERYRKEEAKLKRKEAANNKIAALFSIAINTAVAATKTLGETGIFGLPLLPIIIGLGLAEAAVVLAQPLPSYEKGTTHAPEGFAVVDEKGTELIVDRHGRLKEVGSDAGPRLTYLNEGDQVKTASQTREYLTKHIVDKQDEINIIREMQLQSRLSNTIQKGRRAEAVATMSEALRSTGILHQSLTSEIVNAIKDIPVFQTIFDENGIHEREKRRNDLIKHRNTYNFSFKKNSN